MELVWNASPFDAKVGAVAGCDAKGLEFDEGVISWMEGTGAPGKGGRGTELAPELAAAAAALGVCDPSLPGTDDAGFATEPAGAAWAHLGASRNAGLNVELSDSGSVEGSSAVA
ncbi:MAG: hypothetical protein JRN09_02375 [Nitrososphaerota archaeon]|nr:hypothetical protein [Nitrososphaerota archaeon]